MSLPTLSIEPGLELLPPDRELAEELFALVDETRESLAPSLDLVLMIEKPEHARAYLHSEAKYNEGGQRCNYFLAFQGKLAGSVGLVSIDRRNHSAEMGYWLARKYEGQGLMTKACRRLLDYAFEERPKPLNRIAIRTFTDNQASLALARRLGFQYEGRLHEVIHQHGQYFDAELFAMLKKNWRKNIK